VADAGHGVWRLALLSHFPLDLVSFCRYKTSISLTMVYADWKHHGTAACARQHRLAVSLHPV